MDSEERTLVGGTEAVVEETTTVSDWRSGLSDEYKSHPGIQSYDSLDKLVKTHINQEKLLGKKSIPDADASPEAWNDFYNRTGRPESKDGYGIDNPLFSEIADTAHAAGLNKKQAAVLTERLSELEASHNERLNNQYTESYGKLVEKYGGEAEAQEVLKQADKYAKDTFNEFPDFLKFLSDTTVKTPEGEVLLGNHPIIAEALKIMFEKTADDSKKIESTAGLTATDAGTRFQELTREMGSYRGDKHDSEYRKLQAEMNKIIPLMN
jgi:hypothetical protein